MSGKQDELQVVTIAQASLRHPRHSEATLIELADGRLLIAWQEYLASDLLGEDNAPNRIVAATSNDGGVTWDERIVLVRTPPGCVNVYSPSFVRLNTGEVLLVYFLFEEQGAGLVPVTTAHVLRSRDEGHSFESYSSAWTRQPYSSASSVAVLLSSGRIILPVSRQMGKDWSPTDHFVAGCVFSDDAGHTWAEGSGWIDLPLRGAMEPHVAELMNGGLMMAMRTQLGSVFASLSADGGVTWTKAQTTGLRSPESCPEILRLPGRPELIMIWNDSPYDPTWPSHFGRRSPLSVAISRDNGLTWSRSRDIMTDPNRCYANPACTITRQGRAIVTFFELPYESNGRMNIDRIDLRSVSFDLDWLFDRAV